MKKWMWVVSAVVIVVGGGGWYAEHELKQVAASQVVALLRQPQTKQEINDAVNQMLKQAQAAGKSSTSSTDSASSGHPTSSDAVTAALATVGKSLGNTSNTGLNRSQPSSNAGNGAAAASGSATTDTTTQGSTSASGGKQSGASGASSTRTRGSSVQDKASAGSNSADSTTDTSQSSSSDSGVPQFTSEQQVIQFAMSHFTTNQLLHFISLYENRNNLTPAQKEDAKQQILSQFTPQEIQAMEQALGG